MTSALRGRDSEVRAVLGLLGRARAGQSGALVIRGEAGTGKTALLDVAAGAARGMTLLRATLLEGLSLARDIGQPVRASHAAALLAALEASAGAEQRCLSWLAAYAKDDLSSDAWGYSVALPGVIELSRGRFDAALARFRPFQAGARWRADTAFWYQPDLAEAAARGGDPAWAAETSAAYGAWAADCGQPWALAVAARCRALTATAGQREPHFAEALRWHAKGAGRPPRARRHRACSPGSPPRSTRSWRSRRRGSPTARSRPSSSCRTGPSATTSTRRTPSWASRRGPSWPLSSPPKRGESGVENSAAGAAVNAVAPHVNPSPPVQVVEPE
jgi:hypothetical protein